MSVSVVSDISLVPVGGDLTQSYSKLQVLRGIEHAHRVDQPSASGLSLVGGEWGVLHSDGTVVRPSATSVAQTFLCFAGTDRFDAHGTGQVTLFMDSPLLVSSSLYDASGHYAPGVFLTVKDLGHGEASVTPAASGDWAVALVVAVGTGSLTYQIIPTAFKLA